MIICSDRITVRDFVRDDVDKRLKWRPFTDPFLVNLNLNLGFPADRQRWYEQRVNTHNALWYAIDDQQGRLIGEMSLRNISWAQKNAVLGILLGAEYMNQGYGTEAIKLIEEYVFSAMGFKALTLEVAAHNIRAKRCYEKCGFKSCGSHWARPNPLVNADILNDEKYSEYHKYFRLNSANMFEVFYIDMRAKSQ